MLLRTCAFPSPLGWLIVAESGTGICFVEFFGPKAPSAGEISATVGARYPAAAADPDPRSELLASVRAHILEYMETGQPIPSVPLDLSQGAPFERSVWDAIREIPFGQTRTYLQVAQAAGRPKAVRAAGRACGTNPVPIIVPCHRVVRTGGGLGGYGAGLDIKRALLAIEQKAASTLP
jgi:AraC family transcriptional regulator, regulatory protein of adaptative response / methylated-DNA-[protein]-cysteine methyltransferase